jgi:hypothetical protein
LLGLRADRLRVPVAVGLGDGFAIGLGGPAEAAGLEETLERAWAITPAYIGWR